MLPLKLPDCVPSCADKKKMTAIQRTTKIQLMIGPTAGLRRRLFSKYMLLPLFLRNDPAAFPADKQADLNSAVLPFYTELG